MAKQIGDKVMVGKTEWTVFQAATDQEKTICVFRKKGSKYIGGLFYPHNSSVLVFGESDTPPN